MGADRGRKKKTKPSSTRQCKGKHDDFRVIEKMPAGNYKIRDYFKSGVIQMAGYADQPDDQHLTGTVVRYNANGTISSICEHKTYANGWITFYDDSFIKAATLRLSLIHI